MQNFEHIPEAINKENKIGCLVSAKSYLIRNVLDHTSLNLTICHAFHVSEYGRQVTQINSPYGKWIIGECEKLIVSRLAGQSLEQFLYESGIPESELTRKNLFNYRINWLDSLIQELSK
jgi:hypothetical protein